MCIQTGGNVMNWMEAMTKAVDYIEENLTEEIEIGDIAKQTFLSPFYFQKAFAMLCGITVGDYIRQRRLTCAGSELVSTDEKIIDIAIKYGYNSPDSFTKAFIRFNGVTPTAVRKGGVTVKSFAPLKFKLILEGGFVMDYKIEKKSEFTVVGVAKKFGYENAHVDVKKFWADEIMSGENKGLCGMFGINMDEQMGGKEFEYMIADAYTPGQKVPAGLEIKTIPAFTWAVFPCKGPCSETFPKVTQQIFKDWLPNNTQYEIAAGYNIEMYSDPRNCPKGVEDENYYIEMWIPVKKK